jgi:hypothetical protein
MTQTQEDNRPRRHSRMKVWNIPKYLLSKEKGHELQVP